MTKKEIRSKVRSLKAHYSNNQKAEWSYQICHKLIDTDEWKEADTVLLYHSLPDEVDTTELILYACKENKKVYLPTVVADDLELHLFTGFESLYEGAFSIQETDGPLLPREAFSRIQLAIIPGMGFDSEGHRLGRGKGYYDRLLARLHTHTIGLAFPFQMFDTLPTEPHDKNVEKVLTCEFIP